MLAQDKPQTMLEMGPGVLFREGVDLFFKGDAQGALHYFRQVLKHARKSSDQNNVAWSLLHIGMVLRDQRQYETCIEILEEAQSIFAGLKNERGGAAVLQELSSANRELDRNALALEYAHQSLKIYHNLGKTLDLAWGYDNMSVIHLNLFHRHESLTYAKKARELFLEFGSLQGLAWNACNLASLYFEMSFFGKAERYYSEAIRTFNQLKNKQGAAWAELGLATVYRAQVRFDLALTSLDHAKTLFKDLGQKDRVAWCLLNQAAIKHMIGDNEDALLINKRAIQLFSPMRNHDGVAWALFQIGQILRDRGQWIKAWQTFRESMNLHTDINNRKGIGWDENDWGATYLELNDLSHARESLVKSKVIADQLDDGSLRVEVDKNVARLHIEEGMLQKAANLLEQTEQACRRVQAKKTEAEVLIERARFFILIGDLGKARQCIRQASGLVQIHNLVRLKPLVGLYLGEILASEGKIEEAVKVWKDVVQLSTKLQQKKHRTEALLGIVQILANQNMPSQVAIMLLQIEKDIRLLSSRKLRAKFLAVKGWINFIQTDLMDIKSFTHSLQILQTTGLPIVERHVLGLFAELYRQNGREKERAEIETSIRHLLEKGSVDLHLVMPRHVVFKSLPISVVA